MSRPFTACLTALVAVLAGIVLADPAYAQAKTLGQMTSNVRTSFLPIQDFLSVLSYMMGVFFAATGLYALRAYVDDPGRNPPQAGLLRLGASALFIFTPWAVNRLIETLTAGDDAVVGTRDTIAVSAGMFTGTQGLDGALGRFVIDFAGPFLEDLLPFFCYGAGLVLLLIGLKRLALANGDGPQAPGGMGTMGTFLVAAMLMAFGWVMLTLQGSLFGRTELFTNTAFNTSSGSTTMDERAARAIWGVFVFLRIVGYISVLRGVFMLREVAEGGRASLMAVGTHMVAGAMLANMGAFVDAVQRTFISDPANFVFRAL